MSVGDVHHPEMGHDPAEAFLETLRDHLRPAAAPAPSPELAALMTTQLAFAPEPAPAGLTSMIGRRIDMIKQLASQVGTKAAAAALGAALAVGGIGSSGALSGAMQMIFDTGETVVAAPCEPDGTDGTTEGTDGTTDPAGESTTSDGTTDGSTDGSADPAVPEGDTDPSTDPAAEDTCDGPEAGTGDGAAAGGEASGEEEGAGGTTDEESAKEARTPADCVDGNHGCWVSLAAHNKTATCGNHGKYVAQVARNKGDEATSFFDTDCDGELSADERAAHDEAMGSDGSGTDPAESADDNADADISEADASPGKSGQAKSKSKSKVKTNRARSWR